MKKRTIIIGAVIALVLSALVADRIIRHLNQETIVDTGAGPEEVTAIFQQLNKEEKQVTPLEGTWIYKGILYVGDRSKNETGCKVTLEVKGDKVELKYEKIQDSANFEALCLPYFLDSDSNKSSVIYKGTIEKVVNSVTASEEDDILSEEPHYPDGTYLVKGLPYNDSIPVILAPDHTQHLYFLEGEPPILFTRANSK